LYYILITFNNETTIICNEISKSLLVAQNFIFVKKKTRKFKNPKN